VAVVHTLVVVWMLVPAAKHVGERETMRSAFLRTLLYLPVVLLVLAFTWS